ncbi:hypothetical protein ABJI51_16690 [Amycolatopsis sp. NEAU-NG30]|uniref:Uncharacterized protein n=1 Tax=Amycolatopsis melonis TaxID=3156488 RepID=A0ABV0LEL1_9PSEU
MDSTTAKVVARARKFGANLQRRIIGITHVPLSSTELAVKLRELGMAMCDIGEDLQKDAKRLDEGDRSVE